MSSGSHALLTARTVTKDDMTLKVVMALAYIVSIPAGVGTYLLTKKLDRPTTTLSVLFITSLAIEILATLSRIYYHNNMMVLNMGIVAEGLILLQLISYVYEGSIPKGLFLVISITLFALFLIEFLTKGNTFFNMTFAFKNLIVISGISLIVYNVAKGQLIEPWLYSILGVLLFYHLATLIYFLVVSPTMNKELLLFLSDVHTIINALSNLFYGFALWKLSPTRSSLSHS